MLSKLFYKFKVGRTITALNSLDDATLKDIGLHRSNIRSHAYELFEKEKKIYRNARAYEAIVKSVKKQLKEIRKQKDDIKKARSLDKISYQREYDLLKKLEEKEDKIADKFNKSFLKRFSRSSKKGKLILKD